MNCQKGDLARIVIPEGHEDDWMRDKIVTCESLTLHPRTHAPAWRISPKLKLPWCLCGQCYVENVLDSALRPIRPGPGEDETLSWAPVPSKKLDLVDA